MGKTVHIRNVSIGGNRPFVLIAGPCVIESRQHALKMAKEIKKITARLRIPFVFKASYDKANRTSLKSYRGPGFIQGLEILKEIRETLNIPILSDVHDLREVEPAAEVLDVIQIPAFLCRQTDLLMAAGQAGKVVNVKKGQFLAPSDMKRVVEKLESSGNKRIMLTERGVSFGYNTLVSDFRGLEIMRQIGYPVIFDATHSVQEPGGLGHASGGQSQYVPLLARCAVAAGCDGVFMEVHTNPKKALSDGPNMIALNKLEPVLKDLKAIDAIVKRKKKR